VLRVVAALFLAGALASGARQLAVPPPAPTDSDWRFARGTADEGLPAPATAMPADTVAVRLPHRVLEPNTPLWYTSRFAIPPASALFVEADDGAQVFVDGVRTDHYRRWFAVPESSAAARTVVVRVLNNAVQGGLRSVRVVPAADVVRVSMERGPLAAGFVPVETQAFRSRMPAPGHPCRFSAWADSQGGLNTFSRLVALMAARDAHFSVAVGDLVNDGSDPRGWRSFLDATHPLAIRMPVVAVAGNHDYDGYYNDLRAKQYLSLFRPDGQSWFAWSCGDARFVAIDLNTEFPIGMAASSRQGRWLMDEVTSPEWNRAAWRILLVHQPPWSRSWEGYDGDAAVRAIVTPLAASHGLDVVIAGHSHAYERMTRLIGNQAVRILITGGAGGALEAPLPPTASGTDTVILQHHFLDVEVGRDALVVDAINVDGRSIDRTRLQK